MNGTALYPGLKRDKKNSHLPKMKTKTVFATQVRAGDMALLMAGTNHARWAKVTSVYVEKHVHYYVTGHVSPFKTRVPNSRRRTWTSVDIHCGSKDGFHLTGRDRVTIGA